MREYHERNRTHLYFCSPFLLQTIYILLGVLLVVGSDWSYGCSFCCCCQSSCRLDGSIVEQYRLQSSQRGLRSPWHVCQTQDLARAGLRMTGKQDQRQVAESLYNVYIYNQIYCYTMWCPNVFIVLNFNKTLHSHLTYDMTSFMTSVMTADITFDMMSDMTSDMATGIICDDI